MQQLQQHKNFRATNNKNGQRPLKHDFNGAPKGWSGEMGNWGKSLGLFISPAEYENCAR